MGHQITAYADERLSMELATMRLFPSEARAPGNIYDVLACGDFRRSCSGTGDVAEFAPVHGQDYPVEPNAQASAFLEKTLDASRTERVWIKFS